MTIRAETRWTIDPFRLATPEEYARVRELLVRLGYEEASLRARFGLESVRELLIIDDRGVYEKALPDDPTSLLVKLFLRGEQVAWGTVRSALSAEDLAALDTIGVLHSASVQPDLCVATVAIDPVQELFITADRLQEYDSTTAGPPAGLVYSPIAPQITRFLRLMPRERCEHLLDL